MMGMRELLWIGSCIKVLNMNCTILTWYWAIAWILSSAKNMVILVVWLCEWSAALSGLCCGMSSGPHQVRSTGFTAIISVLVICPYVAPLFPCLHTNRFIVDIDKHRVLQEVSISPRKPSKPGYGCPTRTHVRWYLWFRSRTVSTKRRHCSKVHTLHCFPAPALCKLALHSNRHRTCLEFQESSRWQFEVRYISRAYILWENNILNLYKGQRAKYGLRLSRVCLFAFSLCP